jgi:hypothetical protein
MATYILIIALIISTLGNAYFMYRIYKRIDKIASLQSDHNIHLVRLVYHRAMDIEDYDAVAKIKKAMPKNFDYHTFF